MQVYISRKPKYDTKVEYIEDNQNVSLPCIRLVMILDVECSSSFVHDSCCSNVLSTILLFDMYALVISIVAWRIMYFVA